MVSKGFHSPRLKTFFYALNLTLCHAVCLWIGITYCLIIEASIMKNTSLFAVLVLFLSFFSSCKSSEDKNKQPQHNQSYDQTNASSDTLQLDSVVSDSVDYNRPESPRM